MAYKRMKAVLGLTEDHKKAEYLLARDQKTRKLCICKKILYSDEMDLNMD